jgi:membrane protein YqaA with SNARE-associated domain
MTGAGRKMRPVPSNVVTSSSLDRSVRHRTTRLLWHWSTALLVLILIATSLPLVSLIAATIFTAQSESVLVSLLLLDKYTPWMLVAVASAGNILGGYHCF